ncbi:hypothetical protein J4206_05815 [Candidatus Woesearchaeota archaeon]|nr:hypothetical protein [Candidatus Woesearchaeota archaeon]
MNPITDKLKIYLQDWAVHFIRSKDVIAKKIADIAQNAEDVDILVNFNDGKKQAIIVAPLLDANAVDSALEKLKPFKEQKNKTALFLFNTTSNLKKVISEWQKLATFDMQFMIVFVNPFSNLDHKWCLFPQTHHSLSDKSALETGLKSLFGAVGAVSEDELERKIK